MKVFEKLELSKFEDYKLDNEMSAKVIGGDQCTGGGFELIGTSSKIEGNNVVYTNIYRTWQSDSSSCGKTDYYEEDLEYGTWDTPRA